MIEGRIVTVLSVSIGQDSLHLIVVQQSEENISELQHEFLVLNNFAFV